MGSCCPLHFNGPQITSIKEEVSDLGNWWTSAPTGMWILCGHIILFLPEDYLCSVIVTWMFTVNGALPRPKLYGKAIAHRDLDTRYANTKKKIVLIHNFYRARVNPPAKNMLEM
ncbi:cysteine-rich secretory protein 2, partial [Trichonephila inaurata madagascariensis]